VDLWNVSLARPDLSADRLAAVASFTEVVHGLSEILGKSSPPILPESETRCDRPLDFRRGSAGDRESAFSAGLCCRSDAKVAR
jgi:hypothetical protein